MSNAECINENGLTARIDPSVWDVWGGERAYRHLGVHRTGREVIFRVWAPHADAVSVCGDFNEWSILTNPMTRIDGCGIWEAVLPDTQVSEGQTYKFWIRKGGQAFFKADPYGTRMQAPPETASVICGLDDYRWRDAGWMRYRRQRFVRGQAIKQPMHIYELHAGSWKRREDGSPYTYSELKAELVPYVKQMGYTHVELMPLAEHPFDGSWGYQICGYYAPTARYGTPQELMALIDGLHEAGIGVILDWVPGHFPRDGHGLFRFDGQPLYEYEDGARMSHPGWGTERFDLRRSEVRSFLISNALFWAEYYHVDGLRVDAVASMLYLDYGKHHGEWIPNGDGGNVCTEAVSFLKELNRVLEREYPDVMTVAEDSSTWRGVTGFADGGLGFTLKWNMGWMNDGLSYLTVDPLWRKYHHHRLTFSMTYAFDEAFVLPVSHDEVSHGKHSLLDRSPGDYWQKFAGTRVFMTYMMTHPGKKLTFMGCEIGQFREWDHDDQVEWFLLDYDAHARLQLFAAELNHFYLRHPALWARDDGWEGFCWVDPDNEDENVYSYRRMDGKGEVLTVVLNFCPVKREKFMLAVPEEGIYEEILNSDDVRFGGKGNTNPGKRGTCRCDLHGCGHAINITLPPMGAAVFRRKTKIETSN